ncbi:NADPH-dependent FMN reductase [Micromonospora sp. DT81.3]|uniref:NADPH-dependent FMN reductase n=1 Tax=Actinomycetes TaxID=1760 RepID=UPI003CF0159B
MTEIIQHEPPYTVGLIIGSLAKASINRTLSKALIRLAPEELQFREIPIGDLPLYSYDYDADYPPEGRALKQAIADVDAILFITPEYNRAVPGALKNAIDWASRPWGTNSFRGKPSGVIGASIGAIGTAVAQQSLKGMMAFCNSPMFNSVEGYLQMKEGLITDDGDVTDEGTRAFLADFMSQYYTFVLRVLTVVPQGA